MAEISLEYTVHGVSEDPVKVIATLNGRDVEATVPGLTVELVRDGAGHTFRLAPEDMEAARDLFTPGEKVAVTFTAV